MSASMLHVLVTVSLLASQAAGGGLPSSPDKKSPSIQSWQELDQLAETTGFYVSCGKKIRTDMGLVCEPVEDKDSVSAEIRLTNRLTSSWREGVILDGGTLTPDDGRQPLLIDRVQPFAHFRDGEARTVEDSATHIQTCSIIRRPYRYESMFHDESQKRLCVRLVHDRAWTSTLLDGLFFR